VVEPIEAQNNIELPIVVDKGVNPSQKVRGTDSKLGRSGGMLPEIFLNFGTLKRHFQRFEGTYKVIVQCA
jgi:hypothetical protein